jgi:flagellar protein FlaG
MTANVAGSGGAHDSTYGSARRQAGDQAAAPAPAANASEVPPPGPNDLMLSIVEDPISGVFVYTTVDRRTGAVVQRLDRAQLMKLREASSYAAGAVLSTRA